MSEFILEQKTTELERAQWDYDRACLLLDKAVRNAPMDFHKELKRQSDTYGALLRAKHKAAMSEVARITRGRGEGNR